jgi:uncharacterized membrane protein YraQ (UPF0718 family)
MQALVSRLKRWPGEQPLFFLPLVGALWFTLYQTLIPFSEAVVAQLPVTRDRHLGDALQFFFYDTPKVLLLLTGIVFVMGIVHTFVSPERTRALLFGRHLGAGNVMAASLGIVTPFCSCSAVPLFIGFLQAGVLLGVTLSFLIWAVMRPGFPSERAVATTSFIVTFASISGCVAHAAAGRRDPTLTVITLIAAIAGVQLGAWFMAKRAKPGWGNVSMPCCCWGGGELAVGHSAIPERSHTMSREREILTQALEFHGHRCWAGVAGVRAGLAALRVLNVQRSGGRQLHAFIEIGDDHGGMCFGDGVQYATGCTLDREIP